MTTQRGVIILAGGASSRMGQPKEQLEVLGTPLLRQVVERSQEACAVVVVVARRGQELPELPTEVVRVDDQEDLAGEGPLTAALTGLATLESMGIDVAFIGAADAIFLNTDHIRFMLDALDSDRSHPAAVPETGPTKDGTRILHPLCGTVRVPVARMTAQALVQSGQRAIKALYEGLAARRLAITELPDPRVIRRCNTREEFEGAIAELNAP